MYELEALIFDVDGTLADTERDGHRVAFNLAFQDAGLDWDWTPDLYGELLSVTGGKERIRYYLDEYNQAFTRPGNFTEFVAGLHAAKTRFYTSLLADGAIPLRPGVERFIREARAAGVRLAIATTTTPENVTALLKYTLGEDAIDWFEVIGAGDCVPAKKPAPDIYHYVMDIMKLTPEQCLAFEDSYNGIRSSRQANLQTLVTVNAYTKEHDFSDAMIVLDQMGEPDAPFEVLQGDALGHHYVDLAMVRAHCTGTGMAETPNIAQRAAVIQPFHVMALLARARQLEAEGRDIVHMEIGEPDFATPAPIVEAGIAALQDGHHHYTPASGLPALRQAISDYYRSHYKLEISPARIIVTPGSSGALQLLMSVLINPGQQVLMADPGYPCNPNFVRMVDGEVVTIPVSADSGYQLRLEHLQRYWSAASKAVMLASPGNPTGTLVPADDLQSIAEFVARQGGHLLVDEIYHGLTYGVKEHSALSVSDDVFVINSFSKFFGMTGWRLGWLVAPSAYIETLDKVAQNIFLAAPTPAQYAALSAFKPETMAILEERRQIFQQRRDYLVSVLRELGFDIPVVPQGAFYLYANCSRLTDDSERFCCELLEQAGVAVTPGKDFGRYQPQQHVRFAYTTSLERLELGVERLRQFLGRC